MEDNLPVTPPNTDTPLMQMVHPNVMLEWVDDRTIAILTVTSIQREAISAWADKAVEIVSTRPEGQPHLVIHDVSAPSLTLTPYIRERAQYAVSHYPESGGRTAVVVPKGLSGSVLKLFINQLMRIVRGRPTKAFFSRDEALMWVRAELADGQDD
mgnify:CR=1 FL=1